MQVSKMPTVSLDRQAWPKGSVTKRHRAATARLPGPTQAGVVRQPGPEGG